MPVSTEWGASLTFPITGSSKSRRSSTPTRCWTAATPRSRAGVARRRPGKRSSRRNGPSTARRRKKADDRAGYPGRRAGAGRAGGGGRLLDRAEDHLRRGRAGRLLPGAGRRRDTPRVLRAAGRIALSRDPALARGIRLLVGRAAGLPRRPGEQLRDGEG